MDRKATVSRKSKETDISIFLDLDGNGRADISTGIPFFDHMLSAFTVHGFFDLKIAAKGDLEVDFHHTVEDVGIVLGQAISKTLENKKQIVLTSDRYPREIKNLEERLINRFNSGMVARIYPPDFETRVAIIRAKVQQIGIPLSQEIIDYIGSAIKSNVRDIEGILVHIEANASLLGQEITLEAVKRILKEVLNLEGEPKTVENIIKLVSLKFDVKIADLKSDKRTQEISKPRQIAMYLSREATGMSFPAIAEHFGGKNHTTVIQAHKKTKEWLEKDPEIKQTINSLLRELS